MKRNAGIVVAVLASLMAGACDAGMQVDPVTMGEPPLFAADAPLIPLRFGEMQLHLPRGRVVGTYRDGLECLDGGRQIWWNTTRRDVTEISYADIFFEQMRLGGYDTRGDPSALFPERPARQASPPYIISGQIDDLRMNLCDVADLLSGRPLYMQTGKASVRVYWQVYDSLARTVILDTRSEGYFEVADPVADIQNLLLGEAFAQAVANLAADPDLALLVTRPRQNPEDRLRRRVGERRSLAWVPPYDQPLDHHGEMIRQAVVTLDTGTGHGSGFFIARDLILTNFHVVDGVDLVRVVLTTGGNVLGRVIRLDEGRDVALIQVEPAGYPVLPIRTGPVRVAEPVYAIGSPRRDSYRATISAGVVSRLTENAYGQPDIQADVSVMPGSSGGPLLDATGTVIGLTYAGEATAEGTGMGLNFFIPIGAALDALGLSIRPPDTPATAEAEG